MLSPFAEPYHHIIETLVNEKEPTEKMETSEEKIEEEKPITKDNNQDTQKDQDKTKFTNKEQCAKIDNIIPMNTEWKQVHHGMKNINVRQKERKETQQHEDNNQYGLLKEEEEEEGNENSRIMKVLEVQSEVVKQQEEKTYNVNEMTIEALERFLLERKEQERNCTEVDLMIEYEYDVKKEEETEKEGIESEIIASDKDEDSVLSMEDVAKLVQEQKIEIKAKMHEIKMMKTTIVALNKKIELLNHNDASEKTKAMQEELETMQYQHLATLQRLEEYEETEEKLMKKLHELEIGQNEIIEKEEEIKKLNNKIKRLGEMETCQEEKEAEWMKRIKEYENKLAMVDVVLADYDMILEWEEGGVKVYDSMCDEEEEMYESDDSSCDD